MGQQLWRYAKGRMMILMTLLSCVCFGEIALKCPGGSRDKLEVMVGEYGYRIRCTERRFSRDIAQGMEGNSFIRSPHSMLKSLEISSETFRLSEEIGMSPYMETSDFVVEKAAAVRELSFENVEFSDPKVVLQLPPEIQSLVIADTNVLDLELIRPAAVSDLSITLDIVFPSVPSFLRQQVLPQRIEVNQIELQADSGTVVSRKVYSYIMRNFEKLRLMSLADFQWSCSNHAERRSTRTISARHVICYDDSSVKATARMLENHVETRESGQRGKGTSTIAVALVVVVIACLIGIGLAVFVVKRLFRRDSTPYHREPQTTTEELLARKEKMSTRADDAVDSVELVELAQSDVTLSKCISSNNIWLGEIENRRIIVKRVEAEYNTESATNALIKYSKQMALLKHENIVSMIGISWIGGTDYSVITEYLEQGTLASALVDPEYKLPTKHKINMCLDIAQALAYLHAAEQNTYIRQFSSRTVLINDLNVCKVSLFHCITCSESVYLSVGTNEESFGTGDVPWSAPELLLQAYNVDPRKTNVYAFGVILGEIWTRSRPYKSLVEKMGGTLSDLYVLNKLRKGEIVAPFEDESTLLESPKEYQELMNACLSLDPKARPKAEDIVVRLQQIKSAFS